MATGTVKWFNPTKDMGLFNLQAGVAKMCSSTSRLLSGPGCVHSTTDKPSSTRLRAIGAKSQRPILGSSNGISVLSVDYLRSKSIADLTSISACDAAGNWCLHIDAGCHHR